LKRRPLFRQLFLPHLAIIIVSLLAVSWLATGKVRQFYLQQTADHLRSIARLSELQIRQDFAPSSISSLDSLCKVVSNASGTRATFIDKSGVVLGDSDENPRIMENHADRPEFKEALSKGEGISIRHSPTLGMRMMYLAVPYEHNDEIVGVVRISIPVTDIDAALRNVYAWIIAAGLIIAVVAAIISYLVSRTITSPLVQMQEGAQRFAKGDLGFRMAIPPTKELESLATTLNQMAVQLSDRIDLVTQQRNELEAVLSSMVEGVIALDIDERVINLNQAAAKILGTTADEAQGHIIQEVIRNSDLREFVSAVLTQKKTHESEITLNNNVYLQAHGTPLYDAQGNEIGALMVLNDITTIKRLENIRRDFVANVSHELRTPVTAIKGFVETLQEGAINDAAAARRFLDIIGKHIDRLNAIIQDLLALSKLEKAAEMHAIDLTEGNVTEVLEAAIRNCTPEADAKGITLALDRSKECVAMIDPLQLEQAVINLLTNAIHYSATKSSVHVGIEEHPTGIVIYVQDQGSGISEEHLPRIFERFYRVDTDRSRTIGGTGLGLAIVKHIALAHNGHVTVESQPGKGSTFRIHLPLPT
jgi:two-component system phosphate regulon sensor histidine kinase PhoR